VKAAQINFEILTMYMSSLGKGSRGKWFTTIVASALILSYVTCRLNDLHQGRNQHFISGGAMFMKFHSMTSSCLFNYDTTFSQTGTYKVLLVTFLKIRTFQF